MNGSPASEDGRLKPGQIIESINGQMLADIDPRIQLGEILAAAEASDGLVSMVIKGESTPVTVKIPVLGAYSETWPLNCPKSDKIVRQVAGYLSSPEGNKGLGHIGMLFQQGALLTEDAQAMAFGNVSAGTRVGSNAWLAV